MLEKIGFTFGAVGVSFATIGLICLMLKVVLDQFEGK